MGLRDCLVQLQSPHGSGFRLGVNLSGRTDSEDSKRTVRVGEACIALGICGFEFNRFAEKLNAFVQAFRGPLIPEKASFKISLMRLGIDRTHTRETRVFLGS